MRFSNSKTVHTQVNDADWFEQNPEAQMRVRSPFPGEFDPVELRPRPHHEPIVLVYPRREGIKRMLAWRIQPREVINLGGS
jgi:hypothetical protein